MAIDSGNLFAGIPDTLPHEQIDALVAAPHARIERIVSRGHSSPPGFWYDQDKPEWVIVVAGSAAVLFEGEAAPRTLKRGDYLHIPAHVRHRVEWTDRNEPTVWIACITDDFGARLQEAINKEPRRKAGVLSLKPGRLAYRTGCCGNMFAGCCW